MTVRWDEILSELKRLKDVGEKNDVPEVSEAVMNLQRMIIELQEHFIELLSEIERLKKTDDLPKKVFFRGTYVYLEDDPEPHCRKCYDDGRKMIHLGRKQRLGLGGKPGRMCPKCRGFFRE
ncbi:MAG: hypothetical protein GXP52_07640 [Deltaproteobacteria bacterium]|nr:hypothetical protein [Deltaproteobacteria bacterium]